jgi:hypothetical protein
MKRVEGRASKPAGSSAGLTDPVIINDALKEIV